MNTSTISNDTLNLTSAVEFIQRLVAENKQIKAKKDFYKHKYKSLKTENDKLKQKVSPAKPKASFTKPKISAKKQYYNFMELNEFKTNEEYDRQLFDSTLSFPEFLKPKKYVYLAQNNNNNKMWRKIFSTYTKAELIDFIVSVAGGWAEHQVITCDKLITKD